MRQRKKPTAVLNFGEFSRRHTIGETSPVLFAPFYQRIGGFTMKKAINSIMLGVLIGFAVSYLPPEVQVFVIVPVAGMLWDRWDEFSLKWGGQA